MEGRLRDFGMRQIVYNTETVTFSVRHISLSCVVPKCHPKKIVTFLSCIFVALQPNLLINSNCNVCCKTILFFKSQKCWKISKKYLSGSSIVRFTLITHCVIRWNLINRIGFTMVINKAKNISSSIFFHCSSTSRMTLCSTLNSDESGWPHCPNWTGDMGGCTWSLL